MPTSALAAPFTFPLGGELGIDDLTPDEADAFEIILSLWPPGAWHELYDVDDPRSDIRRFFGVLGQALSKYALVPERGLRTELMPSTAVAKLPDWERALGLPATRRPPDTTAGRQAAVVSKWREQGSYSLPEIRAILGPLLGYADATVLQIVETDRSALRDLHTYAGPAVSIAGGGSADRVVYVADDGVVSQGGVRVRFNDFVTDQTTIALTLTSPDGTLHTFSANGRLGPLTPLTGRTHAFDGHPLDGEWVLHVFIAAGSLSFSSWDLFVEGARLDSAGFDGRGAEQYYWAAYANPALEGATAPSDRDAALRAIDRIKPAHTRGSVLTTISPQPGALIPSQFIPRANP